VYLKKVFSKNQGYTAIEIFFHKCNFKRHSYYFSLPHSLQALIILQSFGNIGFKYDVSSFEKHV